jgi:hypothetical protein
MSVAAEYVVEPGQTIDYEVDYEEESKKLLRMAGNEMISKQEFLSVLFGNGQHKIKSKTDLI